VLRLNQRNCGGTENLSAGLYHSGLSADPRAVIEELIAVDRLPSIGITGYSLGGNLALKLAGEYADQAPHQLHSVCAVSPTIDLASCVAALERPENRLYQWNFVRNLKSRMRRKARLFPALFPLDGLRRVSTVREFDELFTAPHHGFRDADDYYHRASALRVIDRIRVPALIITAEDDPFVPPAQFLDPGVRDNPAIRTVITRFGGHCGFVSPSEMGDDGYWAETRVVEFSREQAMPDTPPVAVPRVVDPT
jgi:predicted alpha/beta-fold hydrolase